MAARPVRGGSLGHKTVALITTITALLVIVVVASADWSEEAIHDPARALSLGPLGAFTADRSDILPAFSSNELLTFLLAGVATVASGVVVWKFRPDALTGPQIVLIGILWLIPGVRRSSDPALFTVGAVLTYAFVPLAIQTGLGYPTGRLKGWLERWCVGAVWFLGTIGVACEWLYFDPRAAPSTHTSTARNLLLIRNDLELAETLQLTVGIAAAVLSIMMLIVIAARWRSGTQRYRAEFAPIAAAGLFVFVLFASAMLMAATGGAFPGEEHSWTFDLRNPTFALLPCVVAVVVARYHFAQVAIKSAMIEIGTAPIVDGFVEALSKALRDPNLVLWAYSEKEQRYIDERGMPRELTDVPAGRGVTTLERGGLPVGAVIHDETLSAQPELLAAVHSATTLALEHDRMRTELEAQLIEVQHSRERIVVAGDVQRRRIERDIHDGAQQHLLAAAIQLSRAKRATSDANVRALIEQGESKLQNTLTSLRDLARGVYPSVLTNSGLRAALNSLAERTMLLPVEIIDNLHARPPARIELAAYFVAAEAIANAQKYSDASHVEIHIRDDDATLRLEVHDAGCGGAEFTPDGGLSGLLDRVSALGGTLSVDSPPGAGTTLVAILPFDAPANGDHADVALR